jgi:hypothetical protein
MDALSETDRRDNWANAALLALTVLLVCALIISLAINVGPLLFSPEQMAAMLKAWRWRLPQTAFEQLPSAVVSIGALIALLTYRRERKKWEHEKARTRSEFFFRQAAAGLDEVLSLLKDQNNDRVIWVRAARSLLQARALATKVELPEYQNAYRLHEHKVRNDLYLALSIYDAATGRRQPLPPQFFYGVKDWTVQRPLDDVAVQASTQPEAYNVDINSVPPQPHLLPLAAKTVVAIFDFLDYPKEYDDPLQQVRVWDGDWTTTHREKAGAARYVAHTKSKTAFAGKIYDNK